MGLALLIRAQQGLISCAGSGQARPGPGDCGRGDQLLAGSPTAESAHAGHVSPSINPRLLAPGHSWAQWHPAPWSDITPPPNQPLSEQEARRERDGGWGEGITAVSFHELHSHTHTPQLPGLICSPLVSQGWAPHTQLCPCPSVPTCSPGPGLHSSAGAPQF